MVRHAAGFRLDIQGLRAVAVLLVVAFHMGLPIAGYIGVDVFFVISGFVITALLLKEVESTGSVNLLNFWRRRFIRLMPALALLVTVVFVAAWLFLLPQQRELTSFTGLGAMFLTANVVIARTSGNYFDPPAEGNPLLNTWSLSVEEQFYIAFPLALVLALLVMRRFASRRTTMALTVGVISSASFLVMVFAQFGILDQTWLNFYDPIQRAWEFGAGAFLALIPVRFLQRGPVWANFSGIAGVVLLCGSLFVLRFPTGYPSLMALLPVVASMLIILAGMSAANYFSKLLSTRPMVAVGDASYSIYLWHWPAISIAMLVGIETTAELGVVALASFIPAWLSYRYVESPLRERMRSGKKISWRVPTATMVVPVGAALLLLGLPSASTGLEGDTKLGYLNYIAQNSVACTGISVAVPGTRCRQTQPHLDPELIIIGDSHGEHLFPGAIDVLSGVPTAYVYLEDWPSIVSQDSVEVIEQVAGMQSVQTVVVSARWNPINVESHQLSESLAQLTSAGKKVLVLDDVPYFDFHAMECQYARVLGPRPRCTMTRADFDVFRESYVGRLAEVSSESAADFAHVGLLFCDDELCSMVQNGRIQYSDNGHLNRDGSVLVLDSLKDDLL